MYPSTHFTIAFGLNKNQNKSGEATTSSGLWNGQIGSTHQASKCLFPGPVTPLCQTGKKKDEPFQDPAFDLDHMTWDGMSEYVVLCLKMRCPFLASNMYDLKEKGHLILRHPIWVFSHDWS